MAKLIAFKIQIALTTQAVGEKADHLVQSHASVDDGRQGRKDGHVCVHLRVTKVHHQCLVPDKPTRKLAGSPQFCESYSRLIVTLRVRNGLLPMATVDQGVTNVSYVPILILDLLQNLDPHIWNSH